MKKSLGNLGLGLVLAGLGIAFVINANLGAFPITSLNLGVVNLLGVSYGMANMIVEVFILAFNIKHKEKIGIATVANSVITGYIIDLFTFILPTQSNLIINILFLLVGIIIFALSQYFITKAGLGNSSNNGLMNVLMKKTGKSVSFIRTIQESVIVAIALLLGGKSIGIATLALSLGFGFVLGFIYKLFKFEPEKVVHRYIEIKRHHTYSLEIDKEFDNIKISKGDAKYD